MSKKVDLSLFDNSWYDSGAGSMKRFTWYVTNALFFQSRVILPYKFKAAILRFFGAKVGAGVVVKPGVNIKYPWKLCIGKNSWIGENVWIDCLDQVSIGANVCVSQGALILSGNHDYKKTSFDLIVKPITIHDCAWIGAKSTVVQGAVVEEGVVVTANSLVKGRLKANGIYQGNPAVWQKERKLL